MKKLNPIQKADMDAITAGVEAGFAPNRAELRRLAKYSGISFKQLREITPTSEPARNNS